MAPMVTRAGIRCPVIPPHAMMTMNVVTDTHIVLMGLMKRAVQKVVDVNI